MAGDGKGFLVLWQGVPVAASNAEERRPALASDGAGRLLLVYEKAQAAGWAVCARVLRSE